MLVQYKVSGTSILLFLLLSLVASQNPNEFEPIRNQNRRISDPVSNFFSELGDLILDVDRTVAVQNQPKIEHEANVMSELVRPQPDYFDRIQKNYRNIQKRLGKFIGDTIGFKNTYSNHELSTVHPPVGDYVPTVKPDYNPFAAAAEARKGKLKEKISKGSRSNLKDAVNPKISVSEVLDDSLKTFGKLSKTIIDDVENLARKRSPPKSDKIISPKRSGSLSIVEECENEILEDPDLEEHSRRRCSPVAIEEQLNSNIKNPSSESKLNTEDLSDSEIVERLLKLIYGRSGDILIENEISVPESDSEAVSYKSSECMGKALPDATLEKIRREKCALISDEERLLKDLNKLLDTKQTNGYGLIDVGSDSADLSSVLLKRSGEDQNDLPSVLSFDNRLRELLKDHGIWMLDYPLLKRWRQRDRSSDNIEKSSEQISDDVELTTVGSTSEAQPTEVYMPVSTDYEFAFEKSGEISSGDPHESSYYRIINEDGDVTEEEVDIVLEPESLANDIETMVSREPKESVILAFTSDGVPLKLRFGPEIDNPLHYLHKVLKSAGASLNIPVESYDDLEPVGKEVFKLGSGILTRAVLINASNSNELKSLLKALMSSKSSGKTTL